jgi:L-ascorbate metabolism protein UlaG (beta-lactamase superfamily)
MDIGKTGVSIDFLGNSGFLVRNGVRIAIDPYNVSSSNVKADVILITHSHEDNCSIKDIESVIDQGKGAIVVCPADCQSKVLKLKSVQMEVVEVGDKFDIGGAKIEVVPAYNKYRDYHPKSEGWHGYLIKTGNVVVYHAGDTDFIPEMQKLSGHGKHDTEFIAILPVSGKTVMNAEQASDAASVISPDLTIPMKFSEENKSCAENFIEFCKEKNVNALILEKL